MKTPIKDWGVVKFLKDKLPNAAGDIAQTALGIATGENPVKAVADLLSGHSDKLSKTDIQQAQQLFASDLEREKMITADRQDARALQKAALQQEDRFAKRFTYYYALIVSFMAFAMITLLFFVQIPDNNQQMIYVSFGAIVATGLVSVFQYFFGSSSGSRDKAEQIKSMLSKVEPE